MIWRLRRHEPSFSSMNEKSFESRRVRTQPWTRTPEIGAVLARAFFTEIGPDMPEVGRGLCIRQASCSYAAMSAFGPVNCKWRVFTAIPPRRDRRYNKNFHCDAFRTANRN